MTGWQLVLEGAKLLLLGALMIISIPLFILMALLSIEFAVMMTFFGTSVLDRIHRFDRNVKEWFND